MPQHTAIDTDAPPGINLADLQPSDESSCIEENEPDDVDPYENDPDYYVDYDDQPPNPDDSEPEPVDEEDENNNDDPENDGQNENPGEDSESFSKPEIAGFSLAVLVVLSLVIAFLAYSYHTATKDTPKKTESLVPQSKVNNNEDPSL